MHAILRLFQPSANPLPVQPRWAAQHLKPRILLSHSPSLRTPLLRRRTASVGSWLRAGDSRAQSTAMLRAVSMVSSGVAGWGSREQLALLAPRHQQQPGEGNWEERNP